MLNRTNQQGITFWGLLMVAAVIAMVTILFFKLLPPYLEYGKVKTALENVKVQPNVGSMEKVDIKNALERRFDIDDVNNVDLKKDLFIEKKPGIMIIRIKYERRVPIAYNVTALIDFEHSVQVNAR
jgi:hypothetical protein